MKKLTIHHRINFKSHFPAGHARISFTKRFLHMSSEDGNVMTIYIPFWNELYGPSNATSPYRIFKSKF